MDDPSAAARPRNLFEKEYYPASTSGARYRCIDSCSTMTRQTNEISIFG